MSFTVKDWRNATTYAGGGDESTPLSAEALEDLEERVTSYTDLAMASVMAYGATGDGSTDDTAAIQAAIDAVHSSDTSSGDVFLPVGTYSITQLRLYTGVSLIGSGPADQPREASVLVQADGVDDSAIVNDPTQLPVTESWHWSRIEHLQLIKEAGATDTLGSGIEVNCRTGENLVFNDIMVTGFPVDNVAFLRGGNPLHLTELHLFNAGRYGLNINRTAFDSWHLVQVDLVSGDNNETALVNVETAGEPFEQFVFNGVKAEAISTGVQQNVFRLGQLNGRPVFIRNCSAVATVTANSVVQATGSDPIFMEAVATDGAYTHMIEALTTGTNLDVDEVGYLAYQTYLGATFLLNGNTGVEYALFSRQSSDPAAPYNPGARLYTKDNGSGKTALYARFESGATQLIATEP